VFNEGNLQKKPTKSARSRPSTAGRIQVLLPVRHEPRTRVDGSFHMDSNGQSYLERFHVQTAIRSRLAR